MAASVTGTFRVIDRASGPMRRMREEAEKLDRAMTAAGDSMDDLTSSDHTKRLDETNKKLNDIDRTSNDLGGSNGSLGKTRRGFEGLSRDSDRLNTSLTRTGLKLASLGKIFTALKIPLMISAVAGLAQGVTALAAGVTALVPAIAGWASSIISLLPNMVRVGSVAAAALPAIVGLGGAFAGAKLAFSGFADAVKEGGKALDELAPKAEKVARLLRGRGQEVKEGLVRNAQNSFFSRMNANRVRNTVLAPRTVSAVKNITGMGASAMGGAASTLAGGLTTPDFLKDMQSIMASMRPLIGSVSRSLVNVANALRHVAVEAVPLTEWLVKLVEGWTETARTSAAAGRETGGLARTFDKARRVLEQFGRITSNVYHVLGDIVGASSKAGDSLWDSAEKGTRAWRKWTESFQGKNALTKWFNDARKSATLIWSVLKNLGGAMKGVFGAATDSGNSLWRSIDKVTEKWSKWTNSLGGQLELSQIFADMEEPLRVMGELAGDVADAFLRLGTSGNLTRTLETLRKAVDPIAELFDKMGNSFGPQFAEMLTQIATLLGNLSESGSVFASLLTPLNKFLELLNKIIETIPGMNALFTGILGGLAFQKLAGRISGLTGSLSGLAAGWASVASMAGNAAEAQTSAAAMDLTGGVTGSATSAVRGQRSPGYGPVGGGQMGYPGTGGMPMVTYGGPAGATPGGGMPPILPLGPVGGVKGGMGRGMMRAGNWMARRGGMTAGLGRRLSRLGAGMAIPGAGYAGAGAGALKGLGGLVRGAGKFLWPVSAMFGISDFVNTEGSFTDKVHGAMSGASFGLIKKPKSAAEKSDMGLQQGTFITKDTLRNTGQSVRGLEQARRRIARSLRGTEFLKSGKDLYTGGGFRAGDLGADDNVDLDRFMDDLSPTKGRGAAAARNIYARRGEMNDEELEARVRKLRRDLRIVSRQGSQKGLAKAQVKQDDLTGAFDIYKKEMGVEKAMEKMRKRIVKAMGPDLAKSGSRALAQANLDWYKEQSKNNPKLEKTYEDLQRGVERRFGRMGKSVKVINGQIYTGSSREWKRIKSALVTSTEKAKQDVTEGFTAMQRSAVNSLVTMGYTQAEAKKLVSGSDGSGGGAPTTGGSGVTGTRSDFGRGGGSRPRARGGRIDYFAGGGRVPGVGTHDSVPIGPNNIAAPGELVVNRHTERKIDGMLPGKLTLGRAVAGERRAHSDLPEREQEGVPRRRHAGGGRIVPVPGFPGESANSAIIPALTAYANKWNLRLTDAYGSGHSSVEHTQLGTAADFVPADGDWDRMQKAAHDAVRMGFTPVGYDGTGGTEAWAGHGPPSMAGGNAHSHVVFLTAAELGSGATPSMARGTGAMAGGAGAVQGLSAKDIKWPGSKVGGAPGGAANKLGEHMKQGILNKVNRRLGAAGGLAGPIGTKLKQFASINRVFAEHNSANGDWGGPSLPFNTIASLAEAAGDSLGINVPGITMAQMTEGESGGRPGATGIDPGGTKGLGLWMITTGYNDELIAKYGGEQQMLNPVKNALAMAEIYGSQGQGAWYGDGGVTDRNAHWTGGSGGGKKKNARGGRVPEWGGWFANGGDFTVDGPTMIGVGERGKERVMVQPSGKKAAGGGGGGLTINGLSVGAGISEKKAERIVRKHLQAAMKELTDELENDADGDAT